MRLDIGKTTAGEEVFLWGGGQCQYLGPRYGDISAQEMDNEMPVL